MRRFKGLWPRICSPENLRQACANAACGKRRTVPVAAFLLNEDRHLRRLAEALQTRRWEAPAARVIFIREPKPRAITVAPFEARVIHHALCDVIEPLLACSYLQDSFACLQGLGSHRAVLRHQALMRRHRHLLQLDVRSYFPQIHRPTLYALLSERLLDAEVRWLLRQIFDADADLYGAPSIASHLGDPTVGVDPDRGLPVGYLTSQVFGNFYLSGLDHFIKRDLKVPGYIRYMDNLSLFGQRRAELKAWGRAVSEWLDTHRHLSLRHERTHLGPCTGKVPYLGHIVSRGDIRVSSATLRRFGRKVARATLGGRRAAEEALPPLLASYRGVLFPGT